MITVSQHKKHVNIESRGKVIMCSSLCHLALICHPKTNSCYKLHTIRLYFTHSKGMKEGLKCRLETEVTK